MLHWRTILSPCATWTPWKRGDEEEERTFSPVYSSARTIGDYFVAKSTGIQFTDYPARNKANFRTNRDPLENSRYERPSSRRRKKKEGKRKGKLRRKEVEESFAEGWKNCRQFPGAEALNAISRRPVGCTREAPCLDERVRVCVCVHGRVYVRVYVYV